MANERDRTDDWFERTCVRCGTTYRHADLWATAGDVGSYQLQAVVLVATEVTNALIVEPPCPACGCVRQGAVAKWKRSRHLLLTLALVLPVLVACAIGWTARAGGGWVMAGGAAAGWVIHALVAFADLNRNPQANRRRAAALVAKRKLVVMDDEDPAPPRGEPAARAPRVGVWLTVGAVGVLLAAVPAVASVSGGWVENRDVRPAVVCPGDTVRVRFPQTVRAVSDLWAGTPQATLTTADDPTPMPLPARGPTRTWGGVIREEEQSRYPDTPLWVEVTLPNDPALAGRTLRIHADMLVEYPLRTPTGYEEEMTDVSHTWEVKPVSKGQLALFHWSYWLMAAGGGLTLVSGFGLWRSARSLAALPHRRRWPADRR